MATASAQRRQRRKLDESVARSFTPPIARVLRREQARVERATSERQMIAAVRESEWVAVMRKLWLSDPLKAIWDEQQTALGTDVEMPPEVRDELEAIAVEHGKQIAATRRDRIKRRFDD